MAVKKRVMVGVTTAVVGGGMLAGALFGAPLVSSAEQRGDVASSGADGDGTSGEDEGRGRGRGHGRRGGPLRLSVAAEALGMTKQELRAALVEHGSVAAVAEAEGVDVQVVVDALVAEARTGIDEEVADGGMTAEEADERRAELVERITELVHAEVRNGPPGDRPGPGQGGGHGPDGNGHGPGRPPWAGAGALKATFGAAAEALGMTEADLRAAVVEHGSLAAVAEAQGVHVQTVIDAIVAEATARIDEEVAAGEMTPEEGAERKSDLVERVTAMVNGDLPGKRGNGGGGGD